MWTMMCGTSLPGSVLDCGADSCSEVLVARMGLAVGNTDHWKLVLV